MSDDASAAQRLILTGGISSALGLVVRVGASLLFIYVAARLFGAQLYGVFVLATAVVEVGVAFAAMGAKQILFALLDEAGTEADAQARHTHVVADFAVLVIGAGALVAAAIVAGSALLPEGRLSAATFAAVAWLAPAVVLQALADLFLSATRWKHVIRYQVLGRSVVEPYGALAATVLAFALGMTQHGLLVGYWAGSLALCAFALFGALRAFGAEGLRTYRLRSGRLLSMARACAVPMVSDVAKAFFFRVDVYIVGALLGARAAGIYGMARQFRTPVRQVRQSLDGMLTPLIARTLALGGADAAARAAASATRLTLAIQLPLLLAMVGLGTTILEWLGDGFVAGYAAMCLLVLAEVVLGAFSIPDLIFLYRRPMLIVSLTGFMILVNLLAAVALTSRFGVDGAAAAVLISVSAGALARRWLMRTRFGVAVPLFYSAPPIAAACGAIAVMAGYFQLGGAAVDPLHSLLALLLGLSSYAMGLGLWLRTPGNTLRLESFRLT